MMVGRDGSGWKLSLYHSSLCATPGTGSGEISWVMGSGGIVADGGAQVRGGEERRRGESKREGEDEGRGGRGGLGGRDQYPGHLLSLGFRALLH